MSHSTRVQRFINAGHLRASRTKNTSRRTVRMFHMRLTATTEISSEMMKTLVAFLLAVGVCFGETDLGQCPDVAPLPGFRMERFFGLWYTIQTTASPSPCLTYYVELATPGTYKITEIEQHFTILSGLHHEHNVTGTLTVPDPTEPGRMALDLPLDIGSTTFTVFMSDYTNYAAVFTCKKYPLLHRWSANILSRTPALDMEFVDKVRTRLASYNVDPFNLQIVNQTDCPPPGSKGSIVRLGSDLVGGVKSTVVDAVGSVRNKVSGVLGADRAPSCQTVAAKPLPEGTLLDALKKDGAAAIDWTKDQARGAEEAIKKSVGDVEQKIEHVQETMADAQKKTEEEVEVIKKKIDDAVRKMEQEFEGSTDNVNSI